MTPSFALTRAARLARNCVRDIEAGRFAPDGSPLCERFAKRHWTPVLHLIEGPLVHGNYERVASILEAAVREADKFDARHEARRHLVRLLSAQRA